MMNTIETDENLTIVCELCGHNNIVERPLSQELRTMIRCSDCCHLQLVCQKDLLASAEFPRPVTIERNRPASRRSATRIGIQDEGYPTGEVFPIFH
jgi:hypothetical protein